MPAIGNNSAVAEACGLALLDTQSTALKAVQTYREHLFMRSYRVDGPAARTTLTALYYVQDWLSLCRPDGTIPAGDDTAIRIPGEGGFPGLADAAEVGPFSGHEQQQCREYLAGLRVAVRQALLESVNKNEEVRRWWLSVQRRRFMNRML